MPTARSQRTWTVETAGASARTGDYPQASFSKQRLTDRSGLGVNVSNGNLLVDNEDLGIAGTGLDLEIGRVYNSLSGSVGSLGRGWGMGTGEDVRIRVEEDESVTFYDRTGSVLAFQRRADGAGFESPLGVHATLRQVRFTAHELTDHETGEKLSFTSSGPESFGRLTARRDRYGNAISFAYNGGGELSSITDTQGRVVTVTQGPSGRIAGLTDPTGRTVGYAYNAQGLLEIYTDAAGGQTRYGYDTAGRLGSITTPAGRVTKITYDAQGRVEAVVRTTDAAGTSGPTTRFAYGSGSPCASGETRTVVSDPLAPVRPTCPGRGGPHGDLLRRWARPRHQDRRFERQRDDSDLRGDR